MSENGAADLLQNHCKHSDIERADQTRFRPRSIWKTPIPSATSITPRWSQKKKIRTAINNSVGFGGHNATLVLTEYTG